MKVTYKYLKNKPYSPHEIRYWVPQKKDASGKLVERGFYKRYYRKTKPEALALKRQLTSQLNQQGVGGLTSHKEDYRLARMYEEAVALIPSDLQPNITLSEIITEWLALSTRNVKTTMLHEAKEAFEAVKEPQVSPAYYKQRICPPLSRLVGWFGVIPCHHIEASDILEHIEDLRDKLADETINDGLVVCRMFFDWCKEQGYIQHNPTEKIPSQFVRDETPKFLPVGDVCKLFRQGLKDDPEILPALALNFFGFLRPSEIVRIISQHPDDIRKDSREIFVRRENTKGKKGQRRARLIDNVPLPLWEWVTPDSPLVVDQLVDRRRALYQAAGIDWFNSAGRHCCLTYACQLASPSRVADLAGHTTELTTKQNYRGIVSTESARQYAAITPKKLLESDPEILLPEWLE